MLEKMKAKLERLEKEFNALSGEMPGLGHMGTPIVDNSTGRTRHRQRDKWEERMQAKNRAIIEQKAKIERMENRIAYRERVTKKSTKFTDKNPIHPALLAAAERGELNVWKRNPHIFFIPDTKIALTTFDGKIGVNGRFPCKDKEEWAMAQAFIEKIQLLHEAQ